MSKAVIIRSRTAAHHGRLAGAQRMLRVLAGAMGEAYRLAADIHEIDLDHISVETEAGVIDHPSGMRYSGVRAQILLRGLRDAGDAEKLRSFVERLAPSGDVFGLQSELVIAPVNNR